MAFHIYAKALGTTKVYATSLDGSGKSDSLNVTVVNIVDVSCVQLDRNALSLEKGTSCTLSATVCPENATNKGVNWSSSNPNVAKVSNGVVCGIANGTAIITATAADGKGACDCCTVTVTGNTLVTSVEVRPVSVTIAEENMYWLTAYVFPDEATNKAVTWSSDNESIATVNANGVVTAKGVGSTKIRATAKDGTGRSSYCAVTVKERVPVTSVEIEPSTLEITEGSMRGLKAVVSPSDATNKSVSWSSSKAGIATVGSRSGCVKGLSPGTTTITAETIDGGFKAYCTVTVNEAEEEDTRPVVTIVEDNEGAYDFFKVTFPSSEGGLVWKSIGVDLAKSNTDEIYSDRFYFNNSQDFTINQLAFLYLLDPLGVAHYAKRHWIGDSNYLEIKDNLYHAIFGRQDLELGRFYFQMVNGQPEYDDYSGYSRERVFSNAEILFGFHQLFDWANFGSDILEYIFKSLPIIDEVTSGIETYQALFFSRSVANVDFASDYVTDYFKGEAESEYEESIENVFGKKAFKAILWVVRLLETAAKSALESITPPNQNDITIYSKVNNQNKYRPIFYINGKSISMQEFLDHMN